MRGKGERGWRNERKAGGKEGKKGRQKEARDTQNSYNSTRGEGGSRKMGKEGKAHQDPIKSKNFIGEERERRKGKEVLRGIWRNGGGGGREKWKEREMWKQGAEEGEGERNEISYEKASEEGGPKRRRGGG